MSPDISGYLSRPAFLRALVIFILCIFDAPPKIISIVGIIVAIPAVFHLRVILVAAVGYATSYSRCQHRHAKPQCEAALNEFGASVGGNFHCTSPRRYVFA